MLEPDTYPMADSWVKAVKNKADISASKLAERANELMKRRKPGHSLLFVVDEVGQFVARDVQKMLDLQAVVQSLGVKGRGKHWIVVTSQEKLGELVSGLDDKKIELARLMDRFPQQVHLEPSDISEVTSRRVLSKNAAAEGALGKLFDENRGRLSGSTRLTADIKLPELSRDTFVDLYPLLPYQVDLIIQVVSGLRTQGGTSKHVGGANRTIIKLAQQLLINPIVGLASKEVGTLVRLDNVYDLVEGNISSEIRAKIASIPREVDHPLAQAVAKAICLLQYAKSVHRTAENVAASLHPNIDAESQLSGVREALRELESAQKVRMGDDGYRIPTPAEDDWERTRNGMSPRPGDVHRLHAETLASFWQPIPSHTLFDAKTFKAGLSIQGKSEIEGDLNFHVYFAEAGKPSTELGAELRTRSQQEKKDVFWAISLSDAIDRETVEVFRSKEMLGRKEREAKTSDETALIGEEKVRQRRHQDELRRLLKMASLTGSVFFRGNDRSPGDRSIDVSKTASNILGQCVPEVFEHFKDAAAKATDVKKGLDTLFTADDLRGLPSVFGSIGLVREEKGQTVFRTESGPLAEVMSRIERQANYGDTASGRFLTDDFAKEPYGWDFDTVRLLVLCLLRAGKIEGISKGQTIESATSASAKESFSNNNLFKQAAFHPKKGVDFDEIVKAAEGFKETFGREVRELSAASVVHELRTEIANQQDSISEARETLTIHNLPGRDVLESVQDQMKAIIHGPEASALATFNASHRSIKDAVRRAAEICQSISEPQLRDLARARSVIKDQLPFLEREPNISEALLLKANELKDLLARESFYRELASIDQISSLIEVDYASRFNEALNSRCNTYSRAIEILQKTSGWTELDAATKLRIILPLENGTRREVGNTPIPQLRSECEACDSRLRAAVAEVRRLVEGGRLVTVNVSNYFADGIETEEQLDSAMQGIRDECAKLIGSGKKVIVQ